MTSTCCLALTLALPLGTLAAQEPPTLAPGTRVRVTVPNRRVVGTLESIDSTTLVVRGADGMAAALPRTSDTRVDVSAGPGTCGLNNQGRCVALGILGGAALGIGLGALAIGQSNNCVDATCEMLYLITVPAGALLGWMIGASLGAEHWSMVELAEQPGSTSDVPSAVKPWRAVHVGVQLSF